MIFVNSSSKTGWFHLAIIIIITLASFYFIKESFAKTLIEWQEVNDTRLVEVQELTK
jgi:hypothetical protein